MTDNNSFLDIFDHISDEHLPAASYFTVTNSNDTTNGNIFWCGMMTRHQRGQTDREETKRADEDEETAKVRNLR